MRIAFASFVVALAACSPPAVTRDTPEGAGGLSKAPGPDLAEAPALVRSYFAKALDREEAAAGALWCDPVAATEAWTRTGSLVPFQPSVADALAAKGTGGEPGARISFQLLRGAGAGTMVLTDGTARLSADSTTARWCIAAIGFQPPPAPLG